MTVCCPTANMHTAYARFVERLERWATEVDTHVLVVLDGHAGPADGVTTAADLTAAFEVAYRNAQPYRQVHRRLDLRTRRVIEDPIVRDSKSSHLVQAADLVAYAAAQWLWVNTDLWPKGQPRHGRPLVEIAAAYEGLSNLWLPGNSLVSRGQWQAWRNTKKPSDDRGPFEGEIPW